MFSPFSKKYCPSYSQERGTFFGDPKTEMSSIPLPATFNFKERV
jgi:hypothetical protein